MVVRTFFPCPLFIRYRMSWQPVSLVTSLVLLTLTLASLPTSAWNTPATCFRGSSLPSPSARDPPTIEKVKAVLEKHSRYANHVMEQHRELLRILLVPSCTDKRQGFLRVCYCAQARAIENQMHVITSHTAGSLPNPAGPTVGRWQCGVALGQLQTAQRIVDWPIR